MGHHFTVFSNRYYKQHVHAIDLDTIEREEIEIASCGGSHTSQELPPIPPELMALAQAVETFTRNLYQAEQTEPLQAFALCICSLDRRHAETIPLPTFLDFTLAPQLQETLLLNNRSNDPVIRSEQRRLKAIALKALNA